MTVWEDLMNCICQNAPQRPGVTEVLDSLQQHTVCTDTACYEGEEAAFGVTAGRARCIGEGAGCARARRVRRGARAAGAGHPSRLPPASHPVAPRPPSGL